MSPWLIFLFSAWWPRLFGSILNRGWEQMPSGSPQQPWNSSNSFPLPQPFRWLLESRPKKWFYVIWSYSIWWNLKVEGSSVFQKCPPPPPPTPYLSPSKMWLGTTWLHPNRPKSRMVNCTTLYGVVCNFIKSHCTTAIYYIKYSGNYSKPTCS